MIGNLIFVPMILFIRDPDRIGEIGIYLKFILVNLKRKEVSVKHVVDT